MTASPPGSPERAREALEAVRARIGLEDTDNMVATGEDLDWLIDQLINWPIRVHPERTTNDRFLRQSAALTLAFHNEAPPVASDGWQDIATAPKGNEDDGPFFDVAWAGKNHRYLPVPARAMNCFRRGDTIAMVHGYPSVITIFGEQPSHFRHPPAPPTPDADHARGEKSRG